jgi:hypothetical protein
LLQDLQDHLFDAIVRAPIETHEFHPIVPPTVCDAKSIGDQNVVSQKRDPKEEKEPSVGKTMDSSEKHGH